MAIVTQGVVPASELLAQERPAWLSQWGAFAASKRGKTLEPALLAQAKLVLLDCVGAIASGMQEAEALALVARLSRTPGEAVAIGTGRRLAPGDAALANGVAGTMLELDEGNSFARGHPGIHVLPALLAARPAASVSGADMLTAFVLGYEIGARIGAAAKLRNSMHPHGTWGTVGAALGVAHLDGADAERLVAVINVASSLSLGTSLRTMLQGATMRNSYAGLSARNGLTAWDLVASGFTGETDGVGSVYGSVLSDSFVPDAMVEQLGTRWEIRRNYFKRHAACRYTHGALDVVAKLLAAHGPLVPDAIESVEVETYVWAAQLDAPVPANMLAAKFSLPFAVATTLVHGVASVPAFRGAALRDPVTLALAHRVRVSEDSAYSAMLPEKRPARVAIRLTDGRVLSGETLTNRGDAVDPYTPDEVRAKFMDLAAPVWGADHALLIEKTIETLEQAESLAPLDALLAAPARADT